VNQRIYNVAVIAPESAAWQQLLGKTVVVLGGSPAFSPANGKREAPDHHNHSFVSRDQLHGFCVLDRLHDVVFETFIRQTSQSVRRKQGIRHIRFMKVYERRSPGGFLRFMTSSSIGGWKAGSLLVNAESQPCLTSSWHRRIAPRLNF